MPRDILYLDAHVHLYEFQVEDVERFISSGIRLIAVSEDYASSLKVLELRDSYPENVLACVGLHPWNLKEEGAATREVDLIEALIPDADCVGEVGLDLKFVADTFPLQRKIFERFVELARAHNKPMNIHSAGAWRETLDLLRQHGVKSAVFHWYTGPLDLLQEILSSGYMISVNASLRIQPKAKQVASAVPVSSMLTESDGPYNYRGLTLTPLLIPELIAEIAALKGIPEDTLRKEVLGNAKKLFNR